MTTIITRLYPDGAAANAAMRALLDAGQDEDTIHVITGETFGGAPEAMKAARLDSASAAAYQQAMTGPETLLVVQAPFNPMGTARTAIKVLGKHPSMDVGLQNENIYQRDEPAESYSNSILTDHPRVMSNSFRGLSHGHILGSDPIIRGKQPTSAMRDGGFMSRYFWPMKMVATPAERHSAIRGGMLFSALFGLPLISRGWAPRADLPTIVR